MPFIPKDLKKCLQKCPAGVQKERWECRKPPLPGVFTWPALAGNLCCVAGGRKATTLAPDGAVSKPAAGKSLQPQPPTHLPRAQLQPPARPSAAPSPLPTPGAALDLPPQTHRRSKRPPANFYQPQPSRKERKKKKKDHDITGRFIWVCLFACWLD